MRSRPPHTSRAILIAVASLLAATCGLISSDIASITFDLPTKSYSFDTNNAMWRLPTGAFPAVACGDGELVMDCCNPPDPVPKPDCTATPLACENQVCTLRFPVTVTQQMDLKREVPALSGVDSQSLVDVTIKQIRYTYASSMNVDLPPVELFIADAGATSVDHPSAQKFGTVPATTAGSSGEDMVILEPNAGAVFSARAHAFGTPFNFIATTTVVIPSGSPIPNGSVQLAVTGRLSAGL